MKKNILFVAIVYALASLFTSCDRKADFHSESFVTFESVSFSVSEADGKLSIPVSIFNPIDKAVNIIVRVNSDSAHRRYGFNAWVGRILWRKKWQPTPVFWSGQSHGQRSLEGYSPWGPKSQTQLSTNSTHTHTHTRTLFC